MKCVNCGRELEEGKLYCPDCGYEIKMVPDFEPEIEETMIGALEEITSELAEEMPGEQDEPAEEQQQKQEKSAGRLRFYSILTAVCLIAALGLGLFVSRQMGSLETQLSKAEAYAAEKKYAKAIADP